MSRFSALSLLGLVAVVGFFYGRARLQATGAPAGAPVVVTGGHATHAVTEGMAAASRGMVDRDAPDFSRPATDGKTYALADLLRRGPVVLTFTKVGCPCSEAAQPYFNRLAETYPGVTVLGVVDAERGPGSLWLRQIEANYPHLIDPDLDLVRGYGVENSAYVVLVRAPGRIARHWPGFSAGMLEELGAATAEASATPARPIDVTDAPDELYSGCPFEL